MFGLLLDRVGPRLTSLIGCVPVVVGNFLLAYTNQLVLAYVLLGFGGNGPYLSAMGLAPFYQRRALFVGLIASLFSLAAFNYMILPVTTREIFFRNYAILAIVVSALCVAFFPTKSPEPGDPYVLPFGSGAKAPASSSRNPGKSGKNEFAASLLDGSESENARAVPSGMSTVSNVSVRNEPPAASPHIYRGTLFEHVKSPLLLAMAVFYSVMLMIVAYQAGVLPDLMDRIARHEGRKDAGIYNKYLYALVGSGVTAIVAPLSGLVVDRVGFGVIFGSSVVSLALSLAISYARNLHAQLGTLFFYATCKAFLIGTTFDFVGRFFPLNHYGGLISVITGLAGCIGMLNIPLAKIVGEHYGDIFAVFLAACLPLLIFPAALIRFPPLMVIPDQHIPKLDELSA